MSKSIAIIGSMNVDLVSRVPRFLLPGETLQGLDFHIYPGGKGGNQAVAAARLTSGVVMLGKLGDDANSQLYRQVFRDNGIISDCVETHAGINTGTAVIEVDTSTGDNRIVYIPGANSFVDRAQVDRHWERLTRCDIFLLQLEIPMDTVRYAIDRLRRAGKTVILDPAPAVALPEGLLGQCDVVTPNEVELALLTGLPAGTPEQMLAAGRQLLKRGVKNVVIKAGRQGAYLVNQETERLFPGFAVKAVDTTAAGDSFNAGLAAALAQGRTLPEAVPYANAVGALSTTAAGAQGAMPTRAQTEDFLKAQGGKQ
ncbi:MAG TPA: ribokinase [Clostridia bacterium]|jgi:ribokinase|nr:ribokinase [Clostridia bacterium]HQA97824.1 ribokinase [Clostridia bacterium]HQO57079.1 ribokinase [Clostridia bacterium]HUM61579.1 ribokinase [Clostridia bacterium]